MRKKIRRNIRVDEHIDMMVTELAKKMNVSRSAIYRTLILKGVSDNIDNDGYWITNRIEVR